MHNFCESRDENDGRQGQGLAMLRLEARRYKREIQQIWMQRELHEKRKATASFSSEDSLQIHDRWRFSETFTTSPATSATPMFWSREDVAVSQFEKLAIVEEGTQTDAPSKGEVQTETEKQQYDADVVLGMGDSRTMPSAPDDLSMLKTCSKECDELRSRISQEGARECLGDAAVRVNADVVFTAIPKRVAVETQVETSEYTYSRFLRADEKGTLSTMETSLNKGEKSTDPVEYHRTGLRDLVSPVSKHDMACSPIYNLHDDGARFRSLRETYKNSTPTEMFSWQQDRSEPERCSTFPPATFSTQVSAPLPEASFGGTKAGDNTSAFFAELSGSRRVRNELSGEGAMAARLATKIIHALEAIGGKGDHPSLKSTIDLPGRPIQSFSAYRALYEEGPSEMELSEEGGETLGGATSTDKEIASSDSSLSFAIQNARRVAVTSSSRMPGSDADVYFQNVMAALSIDRYTLNKEVSPARAVRRVERRAEVGRRANIKSCGDHHSTHQPGEAKKSVKKDVRCSGSNHVKEKQILLSNVQKLQSVAEAAKRLYTDLVNCANDELTASKDCGKLSKHLKDEDGARDATPSNRTCSRIDKTSDLKRGVAPTRNDDVCGRCHVCQPQNTSRENPPKCAGGIAPPTCEGSCDFEQPPEKAESDDGITIELAGDSPSNIILSKNDCSDPPGYNVEIFTPCEAPCDRKPAIRRAGSNQQAKIRPNKCLLDPCCGGPRNSCHMPPTQTKCSRDSFVSITRPPKKDSSPMKVCPTNKCLLDPCCDGPRNSCHMPIRSKCSGAATVCISPPRKSLNKCRLSNSYSMPTRSKCSGASAVEGSNDCRLDPCCVGARNSCHMPTYAKSSRPSCGPDGGSRFKRNNGTKLHAEDPSVLSRHCSVHCRRGVASTKGKIENNSCHERKERSPGGPCRDISKLQRGRLDENSIEMPLSKSRYRRDLHCMKHDGKWNSLMKGKENGYRFHDSSSEGLGVNVTPRNVHRSFPECSRVGGVRNHPTLTAAEVIKRKRASVGKKTRQPSERYMTSNASEPRIQNIPVHGPPSNHVDRAAAAAELAKEIEEMMAGQVDKSNRRSRESSSLTNCRRIVPDVKNKSIGQSNLDGGTIAAANAVKKFKPVSLHVPVVKRDKGNQRVTQRKGPRSKVKFVAEDAIGNDFYAQMHKELEELRLRNTSPARDHRKKLLRLNVGKAEAQAGRSKKDQHLETSFTSRSSSSFQKWKPGKVQAKISTKRKIPATRRIRPPAWVERMTKARETTLLRSMLLAQSRKLETQSKSTIRRRNLQPPGSSVSSKHRFGKHIAAGSGLQPNSVSRKERKIPTTTIQYDIHTGRKIVHSEREPGELLNRVRTQGEILPSFNSLDEKNIRISRRPIVKIGMMPPVVTNSASRYHLRVKGWNADPLIKTDIPHKPADIIRYNRNGGLDVQVRRRDAENGKHRMLADNSGGRRNVRQVAFAGMVVHKSRNKRRPKSSGVPMLGQVTNKKSIASQPRKVKSAPRKRRSTSTTKIQPMRDRVDKPHRYGGGGGQWTYQEGFWTETLKSEKVSQDDSVRSVTTPGSMSQLGTANLEIMESAKIIENEKLLEKAGAEEFLATASVESALDVEDQTGMAGGNIALEVEESENPVDSFKNLLSFGTDFFKGGGISDHDTVAAMKGPSRRNEEDERAEPCSEVELKIMANKKVQVSKVAFTCQEQQKREPSCYVLPQSLLRLSVEVFPDSTENETLVSMFDQLQESTPVQVEVQSNDASECITRQEFLDTLAHEREGKMKEIELERTLMDIVLHTILQDDPLQDDKEVFATRTVEPISLPTNRRLCRTGMRADKEVEAVVHSHDMSQSPLSTAVPCCDRSTEHDIVPHVDRATELDVVSHIDRATELDHSSMFSRDQDSQTTKVEILVPNNQRVTSRTQEECSAKAKDVCCSWHQHSTQVHHQATECRAPWSTVGVQTPGTTAGTISSSPAAMPMFMPVLFQQWGTSFFPTVLPSVHFQLPPTMATPPNVQPPPAGAVLPIGVNQGAQAAESRVHLIPKEMAVQVHHQVPKSPMNTRAAREELGVLEEESDESDWEELNGGSSPSTPSTPLSSPDHKKSLRKAMDLYPVNSRPRENNSPRRDLQPSVSEASVSELVQPIQVATETILEDITATETPGTMTAIETRRGTSWAKVKEMEAATLSLLRAASRKTPSATSSSEDSGELSPELHTWISPGELNIEAVGRSSTGGRFLNNRSFQEALRKPAESCAWSSFTSGRASVGEISNSARFLGLLSEGEVEAGVVPSSLDEPGQIPIGMHFRAELQTGQGSEPGEFHSDMDASSPHQAPNFQIVS